MIPSLQSKHETLKVNGSHFSNFIDVPNMNSRGSDTIYVLATYSKTGAGIPCLLKMTPSEIIVNIVQCNSPSASSSQAQKKPTLQGVTFARLSYVNSSKSQRLITFTEDGSATSFKIN